MEKTNLLRGTSLYVNSLKTGMSLVDQAHKAGKDGLATFIHDKISEGPSPFEVIQMTTEMEAIAASALVAQRPELAIEIKEEIKTLKANVRKAQQPIVR